MVKERLINKNILISYLCINHRNNLINKIIKKIIKIKNLRINLCLLNK